MYYSKDCKHNSLVIKVKMSMISVGHFEDAYVTWKGQVRFMRFMNQPNIVNIEHSEIGVLSELSIHELYSQEEIQSIVDNHALM
jgi:hypothetical protein